MKVAKREFCSVMPSLVVVAILLSGSLVGYAMTPYVTKAIPNGSFFHPILCVVFSVQFACWFGAWKCFAWDFLEEQHTLRIALLACVAVGLEFVEAKILTPIWILSHPSLFLANTPIVQWIDFISTFGLSAIMYLACFSVIPKTNVLGWKRWRGSLVGVGIVAGLWFGGQIIEDLVLVKKLPFIVALVQPHQRQQTNGMWEPWPELIRLTEDALEQGERFDLIVWPENVLTSSSRPSSISQIVWSQYESKSESPAHSENERTHFDIASMVHHFKKRTGASLLAGSILVNQGEAVKFGLTISESQQRNCACLWNANTSEGNDRLQIHDKQVLVPVMETMPSWLGSDWARNWLFGRRTFVQLTPGDQYRELTLVDSKGGQHRLAVSICYESWLPWLPQYNTQSPVDAICHLIYDGDFADHPQYTKTMLTTIRLRAIETRTWQLVCSCWAGTAIIDPRGRIVAQLPPEQGVLRSDRLMVN